MKFLIMFSFLSFQAIAFSAEVDCEGIKHPDYMTEYNHCKKIEAEIAKENKKDPCYGLNHPKYDSEYKACQKIQMEVTKNENSISCDELKHPTYMSEYNACKKIEAEMAEQEKDGPCYGLKHPKYDSEYKACLKIQKAIAEDEKADSCAGLKHPKYMAEYNACKQVEKKLFFEGKKGQVCGLMNHQDAAYKAANKMIADPKEGLNNYEAGIWYNDWDKSSDNYVPVYDKADHSKAQLVKVSLDSDCKVTEVVKADNKNLLKYLMTATESAKKNKVVDNNCESVDEQTAVCAGNLYKRDKSTTSSLKRDLKKIEDYSGSDNKATTAAKAAAAK